MLIEGSALQKPTGKRDPSMDEKAKRESVSRQASVWLSNCLSATDPQPGSRRAKLMAACVIVFLLAFGVRLLHWDDCHIEIERGASMLTTLVNPYKQDARRMAENGGLLFSARPVEPGDGSLLLHPPGYSMLVAMLEGSGAAANWDSRLRLLQVLADAAAAAVILLISAELFPLAVALIAAVLVAISPHLAIYSLYLSPESLAVLPVLVAVYLIVKSSKHPRLTLVAPAGAMLGLSCWLRANALFLSVFLAIAILLSFEPGKRLRYAAALVITAIVVISPITIRNWIIYDRFIPLSLGAGITLIEGIGDYDDEKRFGMPITDADVSRMDAEWFGEPDLERDLWSPRGIERDQTRLARGLAVVLSNPAWFFKVMLRRAAFMLRYNDSTPGGWPFYTRLAPYVSAEPPFRHLAADSEQLQPVWSNSETCRFSAGEIISPQGVVSPLADVQTARLRGGGDWWRVGFDSEPIAIERNTDYVLRIQFNLKEGDAVAVVTGGDVGIALGAVSLASVAEQDRKIQKHRRKKEGGVLEGIEGINAIGTRKTLFASIPFASGEHTEIRLAFGNNGGVLPKFDLDRVDLLNAGATPHLWTMQPRVLVRFLQESLFITQRMLPLVLSGIAVLVFARRGKTLAIILAIPIYYLCAQSALHTEYRYIIAIHYLLFVMAGVALYCASLAIGGGTRSVMRLVMRALYHHDSP